jgi:hypothetical protein
MRVEADMQAALRGGINSASDIPTSDTNRERNVATLEMMGIALPRVGRTQMNPLPDQRDPYSAANANAGVLVPDRAKGQWGCHMPTKTRPVSLKHWRNSRLPTHDSTGAEIEVVMSSRSRLRVAVRTLVRERTVRRRGRRQRLAVAAPR